jgi:putative thioredoxin
MTGMDLSSLIKPAEAPEPVANVTDLVMVGAESNIRQIIQLSDHVPVIIEFHATGATSLAEKLERSVRKQNGKLILVRIDGQQQAQLAAAFKVDHVPVVIALVKGQPVPLFEGDLEPAEVERFVAKLLDVATSNGVNGFVAIGEGAPVNPVVEKAYEAIQAGDFEAARQVYEDALKENPRDVDYSAGLAQVKLMIRTLDIDFEEALKDQDTSVAKRADILASIGHFEMAFELLLAEFAKAKSEEIKQQLLELFEVAGLTAPEVIQARKLLTNLLY